MPSVIHFHELSSLDDVWLGPYLDLFQCAFPPAEQVRLSSIVNALRRKDRDVASAQTLLCALMEARDALAAMAWFENLAGKRCAFLWYLAVDEKMRDQGIGTVVFAEILSRITEQQPACRAIVIEVEIPELGPDDAARDVARRRIQFYQRLGCKLCRNIDYIQSVGWQPPLAMHLMLHPLVPDAARPEVAREILADVFGEEVQGLNDLVLE